ncbi:alpha/beta hydrolase [Streptomyces sp. ODS28]|uniref:alpha/beta fold hydrolase n=1 Tax=Streptomyces sp. ODS28 TaxID=3136688 RepID=UPI0031F0125C
MKKGSKATLGLVLTTAVLAGGAGAFGATAAVGEKKPKPVVQNSFDSLGPPVHQVKRDGRTVHYSDTGEKGARPVLFMGGTGTTARASGMTEYLRTTRQNLGVRLISVERNGFGGTEYDGKLGFHDYSDDVQAVLDRLGIKKAPVIAISGGGPYAAHLAADHPGRVSALHLAAALPPYGPNDAKFCGLPEKQQRKQVAGQITDPRKWWGFDKSSPVHKIPGFTENAEEDGARTYYLRGQKGDPAPQVHEQNLYCQRPGPDLKKFDKPVYVYTGKKDTTVPPATQALWNRAFAQRPTVRSYADTGHDVQYRHWDQVLLDVAGYADRAAVCVKGNTGVLPSEKAEELIKQGATAGSCAWRD